VDEAAIRKAVTDTAHMMVSAGLTEAFGHVSMRWNDGFVITSTLPFTASGPLDAIVVADLADPPSGGGGAPLETPMHAAIYLARPDVGAICRGHPPATVLWGVGTGDLPLLHGLGALAGEQVPVHGDVDLISTLAQGAAVAARLGDGHALILRTNGCFAVGETPLESITRLYFLEERARVAAESSFGGVTDWVDRLRHSAAEMPRAMAWMEATFGSG
jgi:HCOMODA/2-hydroxy-3-carboxy-muconic semialdehyde decarboxylase